MRRPKEKGKRVCDGKKGAGRGAIAGEGRREHGEKLGGNRGRERLGKVITGERREKGEEVGAVGEGERGRKEEVETGGKRRLCRLWCPIRPLANQPHCASRFFG